MSYKITPQSKRILAEVAWDARASLEEVARKLGLRAHTVRRALRVLNDSLKLHAVCWTHPYRLGDIPFRVFFRLNGGTPQRIGEFEKFIAVLPEVSWFVSLIGSYQYCVAIRADGYLDFLKLCDQINKRFGDVIALKSVSTIVHLSCFVPGLAHSGRGPRKSFDYSATSDRLDLSPLDRKIITFLREKPLASMQEVGRAVGASATTVDYRFNKLINSGAILGFGYAYDMSHVGESEFLVSLSTKGFDSSCYDRIAKFCAHHPDVMWLGRFIGHWDIELAISVQQARDLETFVQELHATCREQVAEVHIHTFSRLHRER